MGCYFAWKFIGLAHLGVNRHLLLLVSTFYFRPAPSWCWSALPTSGLHFRCYWLTPILFCPFLNLPFIHDNLKLSGQKSENLCQYFMSLPFQTLLVLGCPPSVYFTIIYIFKCSALFLSSSPILILANLLHYSLLLSCYFPPLSLLTSSFRDRNAHPKFFSMRNFLYTTLQEHSDIFNVGSNTCSR